MTLLAPESNPCTGSHSAPIAVWPLRTVRAGYGCNAHCQEAVALAPRARIDLRANQKPCEPANACRNGYDWASAWDMIKVSP